MPDHDMTDDEERDQHPLVETAFLIHLCQPLEERRVVRIQREAALRDLQRIREKLAADPTATRDDLEWLDIQILWRRANLDAEDNQLERSRMKTRERVRRWRARKAER